MDAMPNLAVDEEPFTLDQLDEWIADDDGTLTPGVFGVEPEGTAVSLAGRPMTFGLADWCMRHLADIDTNTAELDAQYAEQLDRLDRWYKHAQDKLKGRRGFFEAHLIAYAAEHRAADPKHNKTLSLPSGEVSSRESKPAPVVDDADAVVAWGVETDAATLVRVKMEPAITEIRKIVTVVDDKVIDAAGERVPGMAVRPGGVTYTVKPIL